MNMKSLVFSICACVRVVFIVAVALAAAVPVQLVQAQDCDRCVANNYLQSAILNEQANHIGLQLSYDYRHTMLTGSSDTPNAADEKVATTLVNLYYSQRLLEGTTLDLYLPFESKAYTARPNYTYDSGRDSGLGDISIVATQQLFHGVAERRLVDWRARAGVKLPTGDASQLDNYPPELRAPAAGGGPVYPTSGIYPYDRAIGSGSVDWIVGSSYVARYDDFFGVVDGQFIGRTTGDNDFTRGNTVSVHVTPGYIFSYAKGNEFSVMLDAAYRYDAQSDYNGSTVDNSGQTAFLMGPQLMGNFQGWLLATVGVSLPLYQTVEGTQLASDYQILASVMTGF
jgi:hypothetical protein